MDLDDFSVNSSKLTKRGIFIDVNKDVYLTLKFEKESINDAF